MTERFEVVFLGTGSPLPSMDRCGAGEARTLDLQLNGKTALVTGGAEGMPRPNRGIETDTAATNT